MPKRITKPKAFVLSLVALMLVSLPASALVFGGSNLGVMGYPEHTCRKPFRPYDLSNTYARDSYKMDIDRYFKCIKDYVENADNDIDRIKEAANEAIRDIKSFEP